MTTAQLAPFPLQPPLMPAAHPAMLSNHWSLIALMRHLPSLSPVPSLACFSALCNFTLEVSLACLLCWVLTRFATSPGLRFTLWTGLLLTSSVAWLATLVSLTSVTLHSFWPRSLALPGTSVFKPAPHAVWASTWAHTPTVPQPLAQRIGLALTVLALLYAAGLAKLGITALYRRQQLARALCFRSPAPPPAQALFAELCAEMHIPVCTLWLLPGLPSPATLGARRPSVYLPPECLTEDRSTLSDILRHELAHVYRRDALWEALARLCRAFVFFHPALHRAFAATRLERELAADRIVIRTHPDTRDLYADTLIRFGWRTAHSQTSIGISFSAGASVLHTRVQSILAGEPFYSSASRRLRGLLSAASFVLFALAAPALWFGFHLATLPNPGMATLERAQAHPLATATLHLHRTAQPIAPSFTPYQSTQPQLASTQPQPTDVPLLPNLAPPALPNVHYQGSRATLGQPAANGSNSAQPGEPTIPGSTRGLGVPSTAVVTAAVDAAVALGRMGLGDHDHDHE